MTDLPHDCDIVMRGGITSGLVYPAALAELAGQWRFRNIGGASAGAIAAALLAAAEHGYRSGRNPDAFDQLAAIPGAMAGSGLKRLFPAAPGLEPLMDLLWQALAAKEQGGTTSLATRLIKDRLRAPALAAAAAGFVIGLLVSTVAGWIAALGWGLAAALVLLAVLLWQEIKLVWRFAQASLAHFTASGFGLSSGTNPPPADADPAAHALAEGGFADWIHATIQQLSGHKFDEPLTIGALWTTDRDTPPDAIPDPWDQQRDIDLLLTTTNLAQGLPENFPFLERTGSHLYFLPSELATVLPAAVVDHLVRTASPEYHLESGGQTYLRLPRPADLPLALGVRLSLSFPMLISAVRLHHTHGFRPPEGQQEAAASLRPLLFSDGGITSNFPVSTFDSLLPTRPTLCINLADLPPHLCGPSSKPDVILAEHNSDGLAAPVNATPHASLTAFANSILDTARNGHENELMTMAGQRDRIVTIRLDPARQGGLNLNMDANTITALDRVGRQAGAALNARFGPGAPGWPNQRWVRLRSSLASLESAGIAFARNWNHEGTHKLSYATHEALLDPGDEPSYRFSNDSLHKASIGWAARLATQFGEWRTAQPEHWPRQTLANGHQYKAGSLSRTGAAPRPGASLILQPNRGRDPHKG